MTKFLRHWATALLALAVAARAAYELYALLGDAGISPGEMVQRVLLWFILFFVFAAGALVQRENEITKYRNSKPIIKLNDFGFEIKTWEDDLPAVVAYIDVNNEPNIDSAGLVAKKVYAKIEWKNAKGQIVENNAGRWFIPNDDVKAKIDMQSVDLESNGMPRKLHFMKSNLNSSPIQAFWRTTGGYDLTKPLSEDEYKLTITLRDNNNVTAKFNFALRFLVGDKDYPYDRLKLESTDKKFSSKEFMFMELENVIHEMESLPDDFGF